MPSQAAVSSLLEEIGGTKAARAELLHRPEPVMRRSTAPAPAPPAGPAVVADG